MVNHHIPIVICNASGIRQQAHKHTDFKTHSLTHQYNNCSRQSTAQPLTSQPSLIGLLYFPSGFKSLEKILYCQGSKALFLSVTSKYPRILQTNDARAFLSTHRDYFAIMFNQLVARSFLIDALSQYLSFTHLQYCNPHCTLSTTKTSKYFNDILFLL